MSFSRYNECDEWEPAFAWLPTPLLEGGVAWLSRIERRTDVLDLLSLRGPLYEYRRIPAAVR